MRIALFVSIVILAAITLIAARTGSFSSDRHNQMSSTPEIVAAAEHIIELLSAEQREMGVFSFETDERTFWNFVPMTGERKGISLKDLNEEQRIAVHGLLQATLSAQGYLKVTSIQQLERLLGELTNRPDYRDPGFYYLSIFGTPSMDSVWGWRYEGHHLSLNVSMINGELSVTPTFMGTNPGQVRESIFAGLEVLNQEISLARALMHSFSETQRAKATITEEAPREIITGNSRTAILDQFEGISYKEMSQDQQFILMELISTYAANLEPELANRQLDYIRESGIENIYFAWGGSLSPTEGHYFRIHGPRLLIEYDNTQNNANHVHTVWRDLDNDFGRDLLRNHYEHSDHDH